MFERYTEQSRRTVFFARYAASDFGSPYIETEHLLLGLLREDKALAERFLGGYAAIESIRKQIESHSPVREKVPTSVDLPLSHECKRVLAYGAEEAERMNHKHIGTEHILLGLLREPCFAAQILEERGLTFSQVREEIVGKSSVEKYLRTSFDGPDREYVEGEIVERSAGEKPHSKAQRRLVEIFYELGKSHPLFCFPELRMKLGEQRYRVPDVAVFAPTEPEENVPSSPPLVAIEVVSPDDRHPDTVAKCEEYRLWGVPHVWLVDPWLHKLHVYSSAGLSEVSFYSLPEFNVEIPIGQIL